MQLNLLTATALLAASLSLAKVDPEELKNVNRKTISDLLPKLYDAKTKEIDVQSIESLLMKKNDKENPMPKLFSDVTDESVKAMALPTRKINKENEQKVLELIFALPSQALAAFPVKKMTENVSIYTPSLATYENLPVEFFHDAKFVSTLMTNFMKGVDVEHKQFLTKLSVAQFDAVMKHCPTFHVNKIITEVTEEKDGKDVTTSKTRASLTSASLDAFAKLKNKDGKNLMGEYIPLVSAAFLDSLDQSTKYTVEDNVMTPQKPEQARAALDAAIVPLLNASILGEIQVSPASADAAFYTPEQLKALSDKFLKSFDLTEVAVNNIAVIPAESIKKFATVESLAKEKRAKLTSAQWNALLTQKKDGCKYVQEVDFTTKSALKVSEIKFTADCLAKMTADSQAHILANHTKLPENILSKFTKSMFDGLKLKEKTGMDVLDLCKNKKILAYIGANVAGDEFPLADIEASVLYKKYPVLAKHLPASAIPKMKTEKIETMKDIARKGKYACTKAEFFSKTLTNLNDAAEAQVKAAEDHKKNGTVPAKKEKKLELIWSKLSAANLTDLTAHPESKFAEEITLEQFNRLSIDALKGISPATLHALLDAQFLPELSPEQLSALSPAFYASLTAQDAESFDLTKLSPEALAQVSPALLSGLTIVQIFALGATRVSMLVPEQRAVVDGILRENIEELYSLDRSGSFKNIIQEAVAPTAVPAAVEEPTIKKPNNLRTKPAAATTATAEVKAETAEVKAEVAEEKKEDAGNSAASVSAKSAAVLALAASLFFIL